MVSRRNNGGAADDGSTRARLMDVAIELFRKHSVAATSLQMISDELGFTKSAIYHHFRTRDDLLGAIIEPLIERVAELTEHAASQRTPRSRADRMLTGYAALAVANRDLFPVFSGDPAVVDFLRARPEWAAIVRRQIDLLAGADPGPRGQVKAAIVMAGIAGAVGLPFDGLDDDALRAELIAGGRRMLGLRAGRTLS
ncbi:TetR/AcrR family transcriptional regulator [Mycolicibacterium psychrotolerans]|uniref:TetR family transcriptional regulator n=1 Tax=Mycolicibacterium psychrotolerans TaxID=216929 RepID=A0A7I7MFK3_9MYCO|nr:TetR/AcrR family transcriptional regulator [Mycolicibacterium psychrotolerans]BBX70139.1 TetR family transcriptional regulator [Mycolicibacterium psychrotolerans]